MIPKITAIALSAALVAVCGCQTDSGRFAPRSGAELDEMEATNALQNAAFRIGDYESAERVLDALAADHTVSSVQYDLERASIRLVQGRKDDAHGLLLKARSDIEQIFDAASEEKAQSLWHGEANKVFKGDAHERATLYALLALSFLERGEYEDAIRCVKNGLLADSANTKEVQYNSDYALLQYLGYVAAAKSGDPAAAAAYAEEMRGSLDARKIPTGEGSSVAALTNAANLPDAFVVVWTGLPPEFVRGGEYGEIRFVSPGRRLVDFLTAQMDAAPETVVARGLGDVNFQAMTRGGRLMDEILADKANVKCGLAASGNILLAAGLACVLTTSDNAVAEVALLSTGCSLLVLGGTCHLVGYCINSEADVRAWQNLPGEFAIIPVKCPDGARELTVRGYRLWDNVATVRCKVGRSAKGVGITHLSMLPSEIRGLEIWDRDCGELYEEEND